MASRIRWHGRKPKPWRIPFAKADLRPAIRVLGLDYVLAQIGIDRLIERVSIEHLIDEVGIDRLIDKVSVDRLIDEVAPTASWSGWGTKRSSSES